MKILSALLLLATGLAQSRQAPFSLTITADQAEIKSGSEATVNTTLTNLSNRAVSLEFTSPLCDYVVEVRDSTGKMAPDTKDKPAQFCAGGMKISGRDIITQLKPNDSWKDNIPVSLSSDMSQPGKYSVQVMWKPPKEFGGVLVKSNTITVTVTEAYTGGPPVKD